MARVVGYMHRPPQVLALVTSAVESLQEDKKGSEAWILSSRKSCGVSMPCSPGAFCAAEYEGLALMKSTGDPFFDDSEEACQKLLMIVEKAAHHATQSEIEAPIAEYGPEARQTLA